MLTFCVNIEGLSSKTSSLLSLYLFSQESKHQTEEIRCVKYSVYLGFGRRLAHCNDSGFFLLLFVLFFVVGFFSVVHNIVRTFT